MERFKQKSFSNLLNKNSDNKSNNESFAVLNFSQSKFDLNKFKITKKSNETPTKTVKFEEKVPESFDLKKEIKDIIEIKPIPNYVENKPISKIVESKPLSNIVESKPLSNIVESKPMSNIVESNSMSNIDEIKRMSNIFEIKRMSNIIENKSISKFVENQSISNIIDSKPISNNVQNKSISNNVENQPILNNDETENSNLEETINSESVHILFQNKEEVIKEIPILSRKSKFFIFKNDIDIRKFPIHKEMTFGEKKKSPNEIEYRRTTLEYIKY